jgi:magnesium-protoporphyrin IX monomethyl ester (oxidative) cyclase
MPGLKALQKASVNIDAAKRKGGVSGKISQIVHTTKAGLTFLSLYAIPVKRHRVPKLTRLQPSY